MAKKVKLGGSQILAARQGAALPGNLARERERLTAAKELEKVPEVVESVVAPEPEVIPETEPSVEVEPAPVTEAKTPAPRKKPAAARKPAAKRKPAFVEEPAATESAEELAGTKEQPAAMWDTTGGVTLPAGWGVQAVEKVRLSMRTGLSRNRSNALLPDSVHKEAMQCLLDHLRATGNKISFGNLVEAAFEQLPADDDGLRALVEEVPDEFYAPRTAIPRSVILLDRTAALMAEVPARLRVLGYNRHSGILQIALVRRILADMQGPAEG